MSVNIILHNILKRYLRLLNALPANQRINIANNPAEGEVTKKFLKFDDLNLSVFKNVDGRKVLAGSSLKAFKCRNIDQNSTDSY